MIRSSNSFKRNISPPRRLPNVFSSNDKKSNRRSRERRWTTGLEKGQLPMSFNHSPMVVDDTATVSSLSQEATSPNATSVVSLTSWGSSTSDLDNGLSEFPLRSPTPTPHHFSQQDVLQELMHLNKSVLPEANHQYQLSYELAVDNSPLSPSNYGGSSVSGQVTQCLYVMRELITTERKYILDLTDIIEGYYIPLNAKVGHLSLTEEDISRLFGNLEEIRTLHNNLYTALQLCGTDYQKLGQCFVDKAEDFKIYSQFCNNYPRLLETLAKISTDKAISQLMKTCQQRCNHALPLGAYLLKPIQRVLKYSLLLQELVRHMPTTDNGFMAMQMAVDNMTNVAEHINEMQKKYDAAVHTQEIQSLLTGWEGRELTSYGDLVLKDGFRVMWSKTAGYSAHRTTAPSAFRSVKDAYVFLFQKLILIVKKKDEGYQYKYHVEVADAQLTEHLKEPTCFQIRQISSKSTLTFQAKTIEQKQEWSTSIKRLLMESLPGLPDKARQLIMAGFTTDPTASVHHTEQHHPRSFTLDRKFFKKDERSESPSKSKPLPNVIPEKRQVPSPSNSTKYNTISNTTTSTTTSTGNKLTVSAVAQTGLVLGTGFLIPTGQAINNSKKDNGFPESPSSGKKSKFRYSSLPTGVPWTRSDSDPNLMEASYNEKVSPQTPIDSSQNTTTEVSSPHTNTSPIANKSPKTTPIEVPKTTPLTSEVPGSVHSSISSPDLHMDIEIPFTHSSSIEYSDDTTSPPISPLDLPMHIRSKSVPIRKLLETIPSVDNTPRSSIIDAEKIELGGGGGQAPSPLIIRQTLNKLSMESSTIPINDPSSSFFTTSLENPPLSSLPSTSSLPLSSLPSTSSLPPPTISSDQEEEEEERDTDSIDSNDELIIAPPSLFSNDTISQYTLDTTQQQGEHDEKLVLNNKGVSLGNTLEQRRENNDFILQTKKENNLSLTRRDKEGEKDKNNKEEETEKHELLFQELMGGGDGSSTSLSSLSINRLQPSLHQTSSQQDEDELTPRDDLIIIKPPSEFKSNDQSEDLTSLNLISPDQVLLPPFSNYQRQTTPYTSIEDIPSELSPDTPTTPIPPPAPPTETVRRWHSFHNDKRLHKIDIDLSSSSSDNSPPKKDKKDKPTHKTSITSNSGGESKLSFLRNKSFGKSHSTMTRPISLVALVHSTRDDSDLVDLKDAIRQFKARTPDQFPQRSIEGAESETPSTTSTLPPLTITVTPPPMDSPNDDPIIVSPPYNHDTDSSRDNFTTPPSPSLSSLNSKGNKKKNRWSQLRSKFSSSSSTSTSSTSSNRQESASSNYHNANSSFDFHHLRTNSEPHYICEDDERGGPSSFATNSLFTRMDTSTDTRRRGKTFSNNNNSSSSSGSKDKRIRLFSSSEQHTTTDSSELSSPTLTRQRRPSRVQGLAREYSKRIQKQQDQDVASSPTMNTVTMNTTEIKDRNKEVSPPRWVKALKEKRKKREQLFATLENFTDRHGREVDHENELSPLTPVSINFEIPSFDSPPLTPSENLLKTGDYQSSLVSSQSFTEDSYRTTSNLSPDSVIFQGNFDDKKSTSKKSSHSNLQRFSSESILHNQKEQKREEIFKEREEDRGEEEVKSKSRASGKEKSKQKRGWVKSLVSKFNSSK